MTATTSITITSLRPSSVSPSVWRNKRKCKSLIVFASWSMLTSLPASTWWCSASSGTRPSRPLSSRWVGSTDSIRQDNAKQIVGKHPKKFSPNVCSRWVSLANDRNENDIHYRYVVTCIHLIGLFWSPNLKFQLSKTNGCKSSIPASDLGAFWRCPDNRLLIDNWYW